MSAGIPSGERTATTNRRANTELGLLVLALIIALLAYTLLGLSQSPVLPAGLVPYGGALAGLAAAAHLVSRRLAPGADPLLLPLAFLLNGLGLVMVRRIDFATAAGANPTNLAPAQTAWTVVAIGAFCATLVLLSDHRMLDRYRYLVGTGSLVLLALPTVLPEPIGRTINGANLWLNLGAFTIQPAELAKIGLVVFFASYLAENRQLMAVATNRLGPFMLPPARAFGPVLVTWGLSLGILVFQNDFGLSLLFFGVFAVLLYVGTSRVAYVAITGALFMGGALLAYTAFAHVRVRVSAWLDPWAVYDEQGFQIAQSLFALGTGGITGVGLGQGHPDFIPFVQTDFIFSAFGEETGLIGATALLLCYFVLIGRGFTVAMRSTDDFSTLLAAGLTVIFALQTFVIIGGVTRLIPLSGLTLPFVSYGGSSLLANYILVALLLRVSATTSVAARPAEVAA